MLVSWRLCLMCRNDADGGLAKIDAMHEGCFCRAALSTQTFCALNIKFSRSEEC